MAVHYSPPAYSVSTIDGDVSVNFPEGVQDSPFDAIVTFGYPVRNVGVDAFEIDGAEGDAIDSVTQVDDTNAYRVRIVPASNQPLHLITLVLRGGVVETV